MSSHSGGEKPRAVYLVMSTESENLSYCVAGVNKGKGLEGGREGLGGEFDTRGLVDDWNKLSQSHVMKSCNLDKIFADIKSWEEFEGKLIFHNITT